MHTAPTSIVPARTAPPLQPAPPLQSTPRTTLTRGRHRGIEDRDALHDLLAQALLAHVGIDMGTHPVVLPCLPALDIEGPDEGGTLYLHGSVGAVWVRRLLADGSDVCVTVTELDGLVLARSATHHSMNYRCAVVVGRPRVVPEGPEKVRALDLLVDQVVPGRAMHLRPSTRKEMAATCVLAVPLAEASLKMRAGDPVDDEDDVAAGGWAGVVPVQRVLGDPVDAADNEAPVPAHVVRHVADDDGVRRVGMGDDVQRR
ncbi:pyridoxamine 5'-phosphate oxidase family protein [Nocardioides yefusunii]|uniref:Pyridoxamine 5'-phosphate oxidase family protein n=1 Tax=Nocardioides yefusunii TaxID=2500546 RepID=A0ABW1QYX2_9ACTN|nr:pyridoxamine 5'-phosphate oxidase family protein [Nocardioides yefusunii]